MKGPGLSLLFLLALPGFLPSTSRAAEPPEIRAGIRAGRVVVRVLDSRGRPAPGVLVHLAQVSQDFLLGCNFFMFKRSGNAALDRKYEEEFASLFNFATLPFYWSTYEKKPGVTARRKVAAMARWCLARGIRPKGHPLAWNHPAGVPSWLKGTPEKVFSLTRKRIQDCLLDFRELIRTWDVVNETARPFRFGSDPMSRAIRALGRAEWTRKCFLAGREAAPSAFFLINDYDTSEAYEEVIRALRKEDGSFLCDAIGIQSHMHGRVWTAGDVKKVCRRFARFGLPLQFTEITIVSGRRKKNGKWGPTTPEGEARQARQVEAFYRALFAEPAVTAATWWDFSDRGAWQGAPAGLVRADMSPKPAYRVLERLIHKEWRTDATATTDRRGQAAFRAVFGTYRVEVQPPGGKKISARFSFPRPWPPERAAKAKKTFTLTCAPF